MLVSLCSKCGTKLAISPEGLCNICDPDALNKQINQKVKKIKTTIKTKKE